MGRLMCTGGSSVPVQSRVFKGLEAGLHVLPALALAAGTYLLGTMGVLRQRGVFLLMCAKRTVDNWVAAAIARHEQQVTDRRQPSRSRRARTRGTGP
jgi:hypothetical protein